MSGNLPFGFGPADDDPEGGSGGSGAGGSGGPGGPFGFGAGGPGGFDMSQLGQALQQLGAMLQGGGPGGQESGPVNWTTAHDVARQQVVAGGDPSVSDAERRAVSEAVRLAQMWLDPVTTFPTTAADAGAWSRSEWLEATLPAWHRIIEPVAEHLQSAMGQSMPDLSGGLGGIAEQLPPELRGMFPEGQLPPEMAQLFGPLMGMVRQMGSAMFGMQVGQALAALSAEVVGAADVGIPLTDDGRAVLLPRNVTEFGEGLGVDAEQVRLYLALREAAHQRLFVHVPWLRARLVGAVEEYARGIHVDPERLQDAVKDIDPTDPAALQEALGSGLFEPEDTEEQKHALARLETMLALVEGWVDHVVSAAAADRLPSALQLQEAIRRRRASGGPGEKTFATLVGLELRPRKLREAATLWNALRDSRGVEGRDALWGHPDLLPTADDLEDPAGFAERSAPFDLGEIERSLGQDLDGDGTIGPADPQE